MSADFSTLLRSHYYYFLCYKRLVPTFIHTYVLLYTSAKQAAKLKLSNEYARNVCDYMCLLWTAWETIWNSCWTFILMRESCHFDRPSNVEMCFGYWIHAFWLLLFFNCSWVLEFWTPTIRSVIKVECTYLISDALPEI